MAEYKSNSHRSKELATTEPKRKRIEVEKVVSGGVKTKKKKDARKLADIFIKEDLSTVKSHIVDDIAIPAIKKLIFESGREALEMALFGRHGDGSRRDSGRSRVSYRSYYDEPRRSEHRESSRSSRRSRFDYDDLVFETRGKAEAVYEGMLDILDRYKMVTVAAMYDLADMDVDWTANDYGWTDLRVHEPVKRVHDGYILDLPKAYPLE